MIIWRLFIYFKRNFILLQDTNPKFAAITLNIINFVAYIPMLCFALMIIPLMVRSLSPFLNYKNDHQVSLILTILSPIVVFVINFAFLPKLIKSTFVPDEIRLSPILVVYTAFKNQNFWAFALESYFTNLTIVFIYIFCIIPK